jgi:hypothetical protein
MRMNPWKISLVFFACLAVRLPALTQFTSDELNAPPSDARLAEIEHVAATSGWEGLVPGLRSVAFHAYKSLAPPEPLGGALCDAGRSVSIALD